MPLLRTDTGCRCRKTLVSMTTTRLRRSRGAGWRKTLFQTCELRMKSPTDIGGPLHFHEGIGVGPLTEFFLELAALVDDELPVLADGDGPALQRPGRGALEVDAGDLEAGAVAGAFEFLLRLQPVRRAAEVRAGGAQGVD